MSDLMEMRDHPDVHELLAQIGWAADEGLRDEFVAGFTDDAVIERVSRDGTVTRWSAQEGTLAEYPTAACEGMSVEDRQTWTSDVVFGSATDGEVHVFSTSLRVGSAGGGTSNVLLGDDRVHDVVARTARGWRVRRREVRAFGLADELDSAVRLEGLDGVASADRVEIEALFADYAWALDTADIDAVLELFSADAVMQDPFGRFAGSGPDGVRLFFEGLFARPEFAGRIHWVSQIVLTRMGEDYRVDSYALVPAAFPNGAVNLHLMAFYRDVVRREAGQWKFVERLVGPRWSRTDEASVS